MARFRCVTLKQPNRSHSDAGSVREFLLVQSRRPRAALIGIGVIMGHEGSKSESRVNSIVFRLTPAFIVFILN